MAADLILAVLHHILVFSLVSLLVAEGVLLRGGGVTASRIERLARLDRSYGGTAVAIVVVGVGRVFFGAKGYEYYVGNPWFWAKMASFLAMGLLSIGPTMRFIAWRRAVARDPAFSPADAEVSSALGYIRAESAAVILILVFAATMARFA